MINPSDITRAIETAFNTDPVFNTFTIERAELVNENPAICPWLGIYRESIDYAPETLGLGPDHWTAIMTLTLIVQSSNFNSGTQAEDDLEGYVKSVITKMFEDTTIRGSVDMINTIKVSYSYVAEDEQTLFFQSALIEMTLEVSTS